MLTFIGLIFEILTLENIWHKIGNSDHTIHVTEQFN